MNITINPGAATDDAAQIDSIVSQMEEDMETLNTAITANIPSGVNTTWSDGVLNNWQSYYTADVPSAMADMKQSATNLRMAVEAALAYDQER